MTGLKDTKFVDDAENVKKKLFVPLFISLSQYVQQHSDQDCDLIQHVLKTNLRRDMSDKEAKNAVGALMDAMKFKDQAILSSISARIMLVQCQNNHNVSNCLSGSRSIDE